MHEIDPLVAEYEHEKFRPREAEALQTLRKVASLVKPIMRQRGWRVGVLTEFWPPENNLLGLNWNKGQKICLRLRYPYDERQFIPLEEVMDTMLHEYGKISKYMGSLLMFFAKALPHCPRSPRRTIPYSLEPTPYGTRTAPSQRIYWRRFPLRRPQAWRRTPTQARSPPTSTACCREA